MKRVSAAVLLALLFLVPVRAQPAAVEDLLAAMTLEQKVAQMFMVSFHGPLLADVEREFLRLWQPGAVVLFGKNTGTPSATTRLTNDLQQTVTEAGGPPLLIAVDQEGGLIAHLNEGFTTWPAPMLLTATGSSELAYRMGRALAAELRAVGTNMNLAPVADLNTNPANPVIGRRSFGMDPELVAPVIAAVVQGLQDGGVLATVKHFPGHGDTDTDSHLTLPVLLHDRARLDRMELVPFRSALAVDAAAVMVAHIWFPALDAERRPASLSPQIVTGLLREELAYGGIIMTDALDMDAVDTVYSPEQSAVLAVLAGHDLIATGAHVSTEMQARAIRAVVAAVRDGLIDETRIDASVRRVLAAKAAYGLLEWEALDPETADERIDLEGHGTLVEELFRAGVTLVQHDGAGLVPLRGRSLLIYPAARPSVWMSCAELLPEARPLGVSLSPTDEEVSWARTAAAAADVVVLFTLNAYENTALQRLLQALPPEKTVLVALQSPDDLWLRPQPAAQIATYSPLPPAAPAACRVLAGQAAAPGRLPVAPPAGLLP